MFSSPAFPSTKQWRGISRNRPAGSDFVFLANGGAVASTLPGGAKCAIARAISPRPKSAASRSGGWGIRGSGKHAAQHRGRSRGRSADRATFDSIRRDLDALLRKLVLVWAAAILAGLAVSGFLAHRMLKPIRQLDEAAALIARQEYGTRVPEGGQRRTGPARPHFQRDVPFHPGSARRADPAGADFHHRQAVEFHRARSAESAGLHLRRRRDDDGRSISAKRSFIAWRAIFTGPRAPSTSCCRNWWTSRAAAPRRRKRAV